ncbi:MAG TPA: winged helix-turn-helix transcriptional regulator [Candidatus Thermoplasmatota archaeon]|nr:winged helix-turn-helix transcriptional regulator [Candidatus Thermoplasmatota archaeon]
MDDAPRIRIAALLDHEPGASTRKVAHALAVDDSTAAYHLRRLRREGKVVEQRQGRERCWYNAGRGMCPVLRQAVPALRREETARVAQALGETPQPATWIARAAGVPLGQVRWALLVLEKAGLVARSSLGRVQLADGADVCVRNALQAKGCEAWGECPVSRRRGAA